MPEKRVFTYGTVGANKVILYMGGDMVLINNITGAEVLLGNCSKNDETIPNLIDLLQRQMNCVRGI